MKEALFGGLRRIPRDPKIDPVTDRCFRCWMRISPHHTQATCPSRGRERQTFCHNCGRRGGTLDTCGRCQEAHLVNLRRQARDSIPRNNRERSLSRHRVRFAKPVNRDRSRSPRRSPTVIITLEGEEPEIPAEPLITSTPSGRSQQRRSQSMASATDTSGALQRLAISEQAQNNVSNSLPRVQPGLPAGLFVGTELAITGSPFNSQMAMNGYAVSPSAPSSSWQTAS